MIKEYKKGRVDDVAMKHFLWHVNGRGREIGDLDNKTIEEVILELESEN